MPASEARIAAAKANGALSKGPLSPETKAISRANSYKHGMAGNGVVLPPAEAAEVARRAAAMRVEMAPKSEMGGVLIDRLAELTVRVSRCFRQETAAVALRVAHAEADFDEARLAEVDDAVARIAEEPGRLGRRLRSMPEGVDRLIAELHDLRGALQAGRWDDRHGEKLAHLTGARWSEVPVSRVRGLSEAIGGDFRYFPHGASLPEADRAGVARAVMAEMIDAEVEILLAHRETLDLAAIEADRAGAAVRSTFDPSKEASLARRYEAAADRGIYRALTELRRVEAEAAKVATVSPPKPAAVEPLGSFRAEVARPVEPVPTAPRMASPVASDPRISPAPMVEAVSGWSSAGVTVGRRPS